MQTIHYDRLKPRLDSLEATLAKLGLQVFDLVDELPEPEGDKTPAGFTAQVLLRHRLGDLFSQINAARGTIAVVGERERRSYQRFILNETEESVGYLAGQREALERRLDYWKDDQADQVLVIDEAERALIEPLKTALATELSNVQRFLEGPLADEAIQAEGRVDDARAWRIEVERGRQLIHRAESLLADGSRQAERDRQLEGASWGKPDPIDQGDRDTGHQSFTETPEGEAARERLARQYDELNGAPEGPDDR